MAREEHDREDLLAEARALTERVEIRPSAAGAAVVIGFRRDGCASVFFDSDPAYHFNKANELRRAFVSGKLLKAENRALAALTRERTTSEVQLVRHDLTADETRTLLTDLERRLRELHAAITAGGYTLVGQVPEQANVLQRASDWLDGFSDPIRIAATPRVG